MLSKYLKMYKDKFGEEYHFYFGYSKSNEEIIKEIKECIKANKKQKEPVYNNDYVY